MEVTAPPPLRKIVLPVLASCLKKNTKKTGFSFTRASSKRFQASSVMKCQCATFHIKHMATKHFFAEYQLVTSVKI